LSLSEVCWKSGDPSRVSGKGKTGPLEAGRGKYSPSANPERVTLEVLSEGTRVFSVGEYFRAAKSEFFRDVKGEVGAKGNVK